MPTKAPKPLSAGEEYLAMHLLVHGIDFDREVVFAPPRKFRFDFVLKTPKRLAIEVDGGNWNGGRHGHGLGVERDYEKLNLAVSMGYFVLRYTRAMVQRGDAIRDILALLS